MAGIVDQIIQISMAQAATTPASAAFNIAAALVGGEKPVAYGTRVSKRYYDAPTVATDWGESSSAYSIVRDQLGQDTRPAYVVVVCYGVGSEETPITAATISATLEKANAEDGSFYHILPDFDTTNLLAAIGDFCNANHRISHGDTDNVKCLDHIDKSDPASVLALAGHKRISLWFHDDPATRNDCLSAGICGKRCGRDPAKGTWAHKELTGITADALTPSEFAGAKEKNVNMYTRVAGVARTFFGTCVSGNFIDSVIKEDWIRARIQERIFALLGSGGDGDGVPYDDDGIQAVSAVVTNVLAEAASPTRMYILDDFTVSAPKFSDIPEADRSDRNLPLIAFQFSIRESIHTVVPVSGSIVK